MHWHTSIIVCSAASLICQEHFLTHSNFKCLKLNVPIEIHPARVCDSSPWLWSEYAEAERGAYMNKLLRKGQGNMLNSVSPPGRVRTSAFSLRGGWANRDHILLQNQVWNIVMAHSCCRHWVSLHSNSQCETRLPTRTSDSEGPAKRISCSFNCFWRKKPQKDILLECFCITKEISGTSSTME